MKRYYALVLKRGGGVQLVKALDGNHVLAESDFPWELGETHSLALEVVGNRLIGFVDGVMKFNCEDTTQPLTGGGIGFVLTEGRMAADIIRVRPGSS
jgi:hypothetical protein